MYEIAEQVVRWLADRKAVHVAQVVATRGFSSRDPSAALAWTDDGEVAGALFPGMDDDLPAAGDRLDGRLAQLAVSDREAVDAGLSCGGDATVFVQNAAGYPDGTWARLTHREPLCLLSVIVGDSPGRTEVFTTANVRDAAKIAGARDVPRLFARGASATALVTDGDTSLAVVTLWPPTTLLVVGNGTIADALADAATLLGWTATVTNEAGAAAEVAATLTESDAAVVLSHDREVDVPALAAVLAAPAGYVGALGSRGTQAARREGLVGRGVSGDEVDRIHGPAGLDIDAHTPGEIAVSIVAEILAARSGSSGGSISQRQGPVHTAGVHAPPPRYPTQPLS
jgi:xanthine dehydrogenase accessory factor